MQRREGGFIGSDAWPAQDESAQENHFRRSARAMKCPSCDKSLREPAPQCPHCKLRLRALDLKFGAVPLHAGYLTDRTERLPAGEIASLRQLLGLFGRKFPQSIFSVFVVALPHGSAVNEYAFWLANRALFSAPDATGPKNFDILLVVDTTAGAASLTVGYGLEHQVTETDLKDALNGAAEAFGDGEIPAGIRVCVERLMEAMREKAMEVEAEPPEPWDAPLASKESK